MSPRQTLVKWKIPYSLLDEKIFDEWDYLQEYFEGMAKYLNRNFQAST